MSVFFFAKMASISHVQSANITTLPNQIIVVAYFCGDKLRHQKGIFSLEVKCKQMDQQAGI